MTRKLITEPALLRRPCEPCKTVAEGLRIGRELLDFVRKYNRERLTSSAVGLAAPQLGILRAVCVLTLDPKRPLVLVNPVIVKASETLVPWEESCISLQGKRVWTHRHAWVEVSAMNWAVEETSAFGPKDSHGWFLENPWDRQQILESVVAQHEIAHCCSLLMTDFQDELSFWEVFNSKSR